MNINATLIGQMFSFIIFLVIVYRYIWPLYLDILTTRAKLIADGVSNSEKAEQRLEKVKQEAEDILLEARKVKRDLLIKAENDINNKLAEAKAGIAIMQKDAEERMLADRLVMEKKLTDKVHNETVGLVVDLTRKLLQNTSLKGETEALIGDLMQARLGDEKQG